jgi:4-amino-4-deoxy-L-arabinose transferase-like glycosyltransferase
MNTSTSVDRAAPKWILPAILVIALAVRGGAMLALSTSLSEDPDAYREMAKNLRITGTLAMSHGQTSHATAYRPPLYPLVLSIFEKQSDDRPAIALLHVLLGVGTVWLVWRWGQLWGLPAFASAVAAMLVAIDPLLINLSVHVLTETLAAFLAALALWAVTIAMRVRSIRACAAAGLLVGLCALCRPVFLAWIGGLLLVLPFALRDFRPMARWGAFAAAAGLALVPWAVRNQLVFGRPIVSTTHGGYTLLLGNNPSFYEYLRSGPMGAVWNSGEFSRQWNIEQILVETPDGTALDELASDARAYELAYANIRREPGMFLAACAMRVGWLWGVLPHQLDARESVSRRWLRYAIAAGYSLELLLAVAGLWSLGRQLARSPWIGVTLLVVCFTAVHAFYWTDMRMRAPLASAVALLAGQGLVVLASRLRATTRSPGGI